MKNLILKSLLLKLEFSKIDQKHPFYNPDGTISKAPKTKKKLRRGRTGGAEGQGKSGEGDDSQGNQNGEFRRRKPSRRRKLTTEEIQQGT